MRNYEECLTPAWETSTHDVVINNICNSLGYKRICLSVDYCYAVNDIVASVLILLFKIPKILVLSLKNDIRSLRLFDINIGRGINEYVITNSKDARFNFNFFGYKTILKSIIFYVRIKNKMKQKKVGFVLGGDEAYLEFSIAAQLAEIYNIPSTFLKGYAPLKACSYKKNLMNSLPLYENYPTLFEELKNKEDLINKTTDILEKRVNGDRSSLQYMPKYIKLKEYNESYLSSVWIFLHDFYDSPGIYGGNIFASHCDWLEYTVKYLNRYGVKIVIKRHPNERPLNVEIIEKYKKRFKTSVIWCEEDISIDQIKNLECKGIVTVYGTVIVEGTYAGIPVVAAGRSPYSGFDVCYMASDIKEYNKYLNLIGIGEKLQIKSKEVALKAECANRFLDVSDSNANIPYDDIDKNFWEYCGLGIYHENNYKRKETFLRNKNVKECVEKYLKTINIASVLNIEKYAYSVYWDGK